jgi:hypothetical protein
MTSLATIIGAVPLAIGVGPGAETRAPLARSIIGGSILATSVTLVVVPVFYVVFERLGHWLNELSRRDLPAQANDVVRQDAAVPANGTNGHVENAPVPAVALAPLPATGGVSG